MTAVQYITNEQGERVGVVLDLETYQRLNRAQTPETSELLQNLSLDELDALANSALVASDQQYLDSLLAKNKESQLSEEKSQSLEKLLARVDQLNLLKARAHYTLKHLKNSAVLVS
ncbi:MAG: hypothetical protein F6K19_13135 [Cyanothece sp. SIO1E1]|nr:hypothetical protein [Cyanothece sp. SIO1E1]